MPKPRARVCLQDGLSLDLNRLSRQGFVRPGARTGPKPIRWRHNDEVIALGSITANLEGDFAGWFSLRLVSLQLGSLQQTIALRAKPRNFGGRQWYFACPRTHRSVSVLWKPPGARQFASRHYWGREVAYASQFESPVHRAHRGQSKIKARLILGAAFGVVADPGQRAPGTSPSTSSNRRHKASRPRRTAQMQRVEIRHAVGPAEHRFAVDHQRGRLDSATAAAIAGKRPNQSWPRRV
jgi:hypothetical protein